MKHKRQFLICKKKVFLSEFQHVELVSGFFLYYQKDLAVTLSNCNNKILIGSAFKSVSGTICADLETLNADNFSKITSNWSGRWILIIDNKLYIDPAGMLGCYYGTVKGSAVISSSLALLTEQFVFEKDSNYKNIRYGNAINWFPPPLTKYIGLQKLLVGQYIVIDDNSISHLNFRKNKFTHLSQQAVHKELATRLTTIIKNISSEYGKEVYLPLTGGYDSRTMLAAILYNNVPFSVFLFEHNKLSNADKTIPFILSKKFKFPLFFIKRTNVFDTKKHNLYLEHSSGQAADAGALFYAHSQYEPLDELSDNNKKIIIRGGVWEVGRKIFTTAGIDESLSCEEDIMDNLKSCFPILNESVLHEKSMRLWIKHTQQTHSNLKFKDRFYLEQRVSGWLSAIEQAADLTNFERIHPANCQDILDLLTLSIKHSQPQIIKHLQPDLLNTPFNKKSFKEFYIKLYNYLYKLF